MLLHPVLTGYGSDADWRDEQVDVAWLLSTLADRRQGSRTFSIPTRRPPRVASISMSCTCGPSWGGLVHHVRPQVWQGCKEWLYRWLEVPTLGWVPLWTDCRWSDAAVPLGVRVLSRFVPKECTLACCPVLLHPQSHCLPLLRGPSLNRMRDPFPQVLCGYGALGLSLAMPHKPQWLGLHITVRSAILFLSERRCDGLCYFAEGGLQSGDFTHGVFSQRLISSGSRILLQRRLVGLLGHNDNVRYLCNRHRGNPFCCAKHDSGTNVLTSWVSTNLDSIVVARKLAHIHYP
mmetsp:Transcript_22788/g.52066  ORF Transcript_22788/g.52066 Transcript_22788/m.52066 type:complete len:290 (-) Transcript_22788:2295-3164(-)